MFWGLQAEAREPGIAAQQLAGPYISVPKRGRLGLDSGFYTDGKTIEVDIGGHCTARYNLMPLGPNGFALDLEGQGGALCMDADDLSLSHVNVGAVRVTQRDRHGRALEMRIEAPGHARARTFYRAETLGDGGFELQGSRGFVTIDGTEAHISHHGCRLEAATTATSSDSRVALRLVKMRGNCKGVTAKPGQRLGTMSAASYDEEAGKDVVSTIAIAMTSGIVLAGDARRLSPAERIARGEARRHRERHTVPAVVTTPRKGKKLLASIGSAASTTSEDHGMQCSESPVRRALMNRKTAIEACHHMRRGGGAAKGLIKTRFSITSDGRAQDIIIVDDTMRDAGLRRCVAKVIQQTDFGDTTSNACTITWPFAFGIY